MLHNYVFSLETAYLRHAEVVPATSIYAIYALVFHWIFIVHVVTSMIIFTIIIIISYYVETYNGVCGKDL